MSATGWHLHRWGAVRVDGNCGYCVRNPGYELRPVLVVDPATARETIARAVRRHEYLRRSGRCFCGSIMTDDEHEDHLADAVLAALAAPAPDPTGEEEK